MLLAVKDSEVGQQLDKALNLAMYVHEGQFTIHHHLPFITHPLDVLAFVSDWGVKNVAIRQAAILHESLNPQCANPMDFQMLYDEFGEKVASIVKDCTFVYDNPNLESEDEEVRKVAIKDQKRASNEFFKTFNEKSTSAIVIAVADRLLITAGLISVSPDKARPCFALAKELFTVMRSRHEDIRKKQGEEVWSRMRYQLTQVSQMMN